MKEDTKTCAECGKELKGCPCGWAKTSDSKLVHKKCKPSYESEIKDEKETKEGACSYCAGEFEGKPYFMAMDGKYVHFKCQELYEQELYKKS